MKSLLSNDATPIVAAGAVAPAVAVTPVTVTVPPAPLVVTPLVPNTSSTLAIGIAVPASVKKLVGI